MGATRSPRPRSTTRAGRSAFPRTTHRTRGGSTQDQRWGRRGAKPQAPGANATTVGRRRSASAGPHRSTVTGRTSGTWMPVAQPGGAPAKLLPDSLPAARRAEGGGSSGAGGRGFESRRASRLARWMGTVAQLDRALALAAPSSGLAPGRWCRVIDLYSRGCGFESRQSPMQYRSPRRRGRAARRRLSLQRSFGGLTGNTATPGPTRTLRPSARARQIETESRTAVQAGPAVERPLSAPRPPRVGRRTRVTGHQRVQIPPSPRLPPAPRTTGRGSSPPGEPHHSAWKGGG